MKSAYNVGWYAGSLGGMAWFLLALPLNAAHPILAFIVAMLCGFGSHAIGKSISRL